MVRDRENIFKGMSSCDYCTHNLNQIDGDDPLLFDGSN